MPFGSTCDPPLGYPDVEELLAERGVIVTCEPIRPWCQKFGQTCANALRLDEVFLKITGQTCDLWRGLCQLERWESHHGLKRAA